MMVRRMSINAYPPIRVAWMPWPGVPSAFANGHLLVGPVLIFIAME